METHLVLGDILQAVIKMSSSKCTSDEKLKRICSRKIIQQPKSGYLCLKNTGAIAGMSQHITQVLITFFISSRFILSSGPKVFKLLLIIFLHISRSPVSATHTKSAEHVAKSQREEAMPAAAGALKPVSSLAEAEEGRERKHHSLPVGCLVDSNKRSSRFTGAHWRTRSSEPSAQSQDPQSPQPIRGYTGGLELLVGGAKYSNETRPTTCSPADGRLDGQLQRTG